MDVKFKYYIFLGFIYIITSCSYKNEINIKKATQIVLANSLNPNDSIVYLYADIDENKMFVCQIVQLKLYKDTTYFYLFMGNTDTTFVGIDNDHDTLNLYPYYSLNDSGRIWYNIIGPEIGYTQKIQSNYFVGDPFLLRFADTIKWRLDKTQKMEELSVNGYVFSKKNQSIILYPKDLTKPLKNTIDIFHEPSERQYLIKQY